MGADTQGSLRDHVHIPFSTPGDVHREAHTIVLPLGVDGKYSRKPFTKLVFLENLLQSNELRSCVVKDTKDGHTTRPLPSRPGPKC